MNDEEFLKRLQAAFQVEAEEHTQAMSSGLLELESAPPGDARAALIEKIFREAHSLKGAARAVNITEIESVCQALENVFSAWKKKESEPMPEQFDGLYKAVDFVRDLLSAGTAGRSAQVSEIVRQVGSLKPPVALKPSVSAAPQSVSVSASAPESPQKKPNETAEISKPAQKETPAPIAPAAVPAPPIRPAEPPPAAVPTERRVAVETVRISTAKLDSVLLQAEELLIAKLTASQRATELREVETALEHWKKEWTKIEPDFRRLRTGAASTPNEAVGNFLDWNERCVRSLEDKLNSLTASAERDERSLGAMVENLLDETKKLVMLPFSTLMEIFPRLVRDLARDEGKDVQLIMRGQETEIDKRILEEMKDPLIHLLRNCVDHGIERPAERGAKPSRATVEINILQLGGSEVEICLSDDGRGINVSKVKMTAVKKGIISQDEADRMGEQQAMMLIFQSDISTSPIITEISGRGLGLAIVREKTRKLGGRIAVETNLGAGTTFRIFLPLTLATFKGIIVRAGGQLFVIPVMNVDRVARVKMSDVQTVENKETIALDGRVIPLVRLDEALELPRKNDAADGAKESAFPALILGSAEKRIGFRVEAVVNEQEVLVKALGKPLLRVRNVSGATVLGDGKPVPILNVADLLKSALKVSAASSRIAAPTDGTETKKLSVLVVEDSITSRMLLKNILETAGFAVATAVDGADGLTKLRTGEFDIVISDVDMPRMNGFDLTAAIRAEPRLAPLPVVLVTARETREDRERGVDAGASAYIVKSNFDQSDLLQVIRRLV